MKKWQVNCPLILAVKWRFKMKTTIKEILLAEVIEETDEFTFEELCLVCNAEADFVAQIIEEGILEPVFGEEPENWQFNVRALLRLKRVLRVHRDFEANLAGISLILELLEELEDLRQQVQILEKLEKL